MWYNGINIGHEVIVFFCNYETNKITYKRKGEKDMTRRKRTTITAVAICLCAMFFSTIRVQAEESKVFENSDEPQSIVVQAVQKEAISELYYITDAYETIESIAANLGISTEELLAVNEDLKGLEKNAVYPKLMYTSVRIPSIDWSGVSAKVYYYVEKGDNLETISSYFGIEIPNIVKCNTQEVSICLNDEKDAWKATWKVEPTENDVKETMKMIAAKETMYPLNYPEDSTWKICRKITDTNLIYPGDFIRVK